MDKTILEKVRHYGLWAVLGSAAILLVMTVLDVWGASPTETVDDGWGFGYEMQAEWWSRIEGTAALILVLSGVVLLALLVASRIKGEAEPAKVKTAGAVKKPAAKKPTAKKAAPKKK